jgi:hypothetical protein
VRGQPLLDYYKCPDDLGEFELTGELSKEQGFFQFGPGMMCYGRCLEGMPARHPAGQLFDASGAVELDQGLVRLPFDLSEVVDNLRRERYMTTGDTPRTLRILKAVRHDIYYFCLAPDFLDTGLSLFMQQLRLQGVAGEPARA